jgi:hypothetical protein
MRTRGWSRAAKLAYYVGYGTDLECWEWTVTTMMESGYGRLRIDGVLTLAHRAAYEEYVGPIPAGMHVLHRCDNPTCGNPKHLFLGDNDANVADKVKKNRQARDHGRSQAGALGNNAKLTDAEVLAIRQDTRRQRDVAVSYGVARSTISRIKHRRMWKYI